MNATSIHDYDIHGVVGIRLVDPTSSDLAALDEQIGQFRNSFIGDPDITIRFKKELPIRSLTYLGLDCAGYTDEGFYILSRQENAKLRVPFEQIGRPFEILCESGLRALPWLFEMINLSSLAKQHVPVHASAFDYNGVGVIVTGWTKGGKTEALLAFAKHGARYVGDEWVLLSPGGDNMFGIPVPICIWEWYFDDIDHLLPKIGWQRKVLFKNIHLLDCAHRTLEKLNRHNSFLARRLERALPVLKNQLNIRVHPEAIFGNRICDSAVPDKLILCLSHDQPHIHVEKCDAVQIADRIVRSNTLELAPFLAFYRAFQFAFPELRSEFLDNIDGLQYSLLKSAFEGIEAYTVSHPYPVPMEEYFARLRSLCDNTTRRILVEELV